MNDVVQGGGTYRAVAARLISRVKEGDFPAGTFFPREKVLQDEFGVSRTTVRRALAAVVASGHAENVPNRGVRAVSVRAESDTRVIALIDGSTVVLPALYARLSGLFREADYHLVHLDSETMTLEGALAFAEAKGYAGALVWSFEGFPDPGALKRAAGIFPIVVLDHVIPGFDADIVAFDNRAMAREAVAHLVSLGKRRIAVTGMMDMLDVTQDRFSGYLEAVFAADLKPEPADFVFCRTSGGAIDDRLLRFRLCADDRPDAVFVLQDESLQDAVRAAHACGLRVPDDLAVIALGDDLRVEVDGAPLPSVRCDWDHFARLAFSLMTRRLADRTAPVSVARAGHTLIVHPPTERSSELPVVSSLASKKRLS